MPDPAPSAVRRPARASTPLPRPDPVVILDGGLGTELAARGRDVSDRLWSARLLLDDPAAIEAIHLAYFEAGADVATTASYQASVPGFAAAGIDRAAGLRLVGLSVDLARRARDRYRADRGAARPLRVAGSVGPYGAMLGDGSEYRGDYDPGTAALVDFHRPRIDALVEAGADLLALETIPTVREAEVLVRLLDDVPIPAWLAVSCRDGASTSAGEPIELAIDLGDHPRIVAVGVNCTAPRHIAGLLERARARRAATTGATAAGSAARPFIAYPNSGDRWDPATREWRADDEAGAWDAVDVASWTRHGATWLGGCCGTGPAEIAALSERLRPTTPAA